ncbi:hypothetical protein Hanom_Chr07g00609811 [Helianthus anomalus]
METGAPREVVVVAPSLLHLNPPEGLARPLQHLPEDRLDQSASVGPPKPIRDLRGF